MGVQFDNTGTKHIKFTTPTNALGLVSKTFHFSYYPFSSPGSSWSLLMIFPSDGSVAGPDEYNIFTVVGEKLQFGNHFSTTNGIWIATSNCITINTWNRFSLTYNGASTANNPLLTKNGINIPLTRSQAPVGTYQVGTASDLYIGSPGANDNPNGIIEDFRIYNTIKTPAQVANIANENIETNATIDESNLVFHAPLVMCKELTYSTFVGSTLGASNEFLDRINGYVGVPTGSPVGA